MVSLTILILALTVFSYCLNTVSPELLTDILWYIYTGLVPSQVSDQLGERRELRLEILLLKKELRSTSAQDQFAKWAKSRRKHDEKVARLEVLNSTINSTRLKFTSKTRVIRWLLTTGMRAAVQIYYIKQPVFYIPHGWVPGYFELLLAFPRAPKGSVSVQTWGLACASVVDLVVGKGVMKVLEEVAERRSQKTKVGVVKKL